MFRPRISSHSSRTCGSLLASGLRRLSKARLVAAPFGSRKFEAVSSTGPPIIATDLDGCGYLSVSIISSGSGRLAAGWFPAAARHIRDLIRTISRDSFPAQSHRPHRRRRSVRRSDDRVQTALWAGHPESGVGLFRSHAAREAETAFLRQQLA